MYHRIFIKGSKQVESHSRKIKFSSTRRKSGDRRVDEREIKIRGEKKGGKVEVGISEKIEARASREESGIRRRLAALPTHCICRIQSHVSNTLSSGIARRAGEGGQSERGVRDECMWTEKAVVATAAGTTSDYIDCVGS